MAQPAGKMYHSGHLLVLARRCYDRITPGSESESQIVIIMSAVALEGFLNELEHEWAMGIPATESTSNLARVLAEAERGKASLMLKIDLTHLVLTGTLPDRGSQPYQDVQLLISVRNLLVHARPEELYLAGDGETPEYPKIVRSFVSRGVIGQPTNPAIGWTQYVLVPEVAAWAYNTVVAAREWIASLCAPDPLLKVVLAHVTSGLAPIGASNEPASPGGPRILEVESRDTEP